MKKEDKFLGGPLIGKETLNSTDWFKPENIRRNEKLDEITSEILAYQKKKKKNYPILYFTYYVYKFSRSQGLARVLS